MNSIQVSEQLIEKICEVDPRVKIAMQDKKAKLQTMSTLQEGFKFTVEHYPHLVEDIQRRIVKYHQAPDPNGVRKISDFVQLPQWYSWCLEEKQPEGYWDVNGKYYGLRMNEVIKMFLIARVNG